MRAFLLALALFLLLPGRTLCAEETEGPTQPDGVDVGAMFIGRFQVRDTGSTPYEFSVPMARLKLDWEPEKWLHAQLEADMETLFEAGKSRALLRDAYIEVRPWRWLRLRAGQFKRPFSALELRSRSSLESTTRGLANGLLVGDLGFGDRDIGCQVETRFGRRKRRIEATLGLFNGSGRNQVESDANGAKDLVARVTAKARDWLTFGAGFSLKLFDTESVAYYPSWSWLSGLDVTVDKGNLFLLAEGLFGLNHDRCATAPVPTDCRADSEGGTIPYAAAGTLLVAYRIPLYRAWKLALQPVLRGEFLVPDQSRTDGHVLTVGGGLNLLLTRDYRVMVHAELVRPGAGAPAAFESENRLVVQLAVSL